MAQITLNSTGVASDGSLVLQSNGTTAAVTIDTSQRASFVAGTAALPAITTTGDTNTGIFFPAADTIAFSEGGAEAMRIDSRGNVGIGASSPSASYKMSITGNSASIYSGILFTDTNAGGGVFSIYGESAALKFRDSSAGATRMTIDSSGNLLITSAASLGYGTGSGGSVTQATSKGTGVTINKANGRITMNNAALGAGGTVVFLVSNSLVASTDTVVINVNDAARGDLYNVWVWYLITGGFYVALKNLGGISYSDAVVLNFSVIKATTS